MSENELREYELQMLNTCIQTYYNLYGVMPGTQELMDMLGLRFVPYITVRHAA